MYVLTYRGMRTVLILWLDNLPGLPSSDDAHISWHSIV